MLEVRDRGCLVELPETIVDGVGEPTDARSVRGDVAVFCF